MIDNKEKSLFIFDLDGVIFDSKRNMEVAWNETSKKFKLNISFARYFNEIGKPFLKILKSLGIEQNKKIYEHFKKISIREINKIKPYEGVIDQLKYLKKKKIKFSIVTSKDRARTTFLLKKHDIRPDSVHCPNNILRGKPFPDHLLYSIKKNKKKRGQACFVGDTKVDYQAAKKANILFIFAEYGYGSSDKLYKNKITNFKQIRRFINN